MGVLDASAALEILLKTPLGVRAVEHVLLPGETLHAPHLLDIEFMQVLRRLTQAGALAPDRAQQAVEDLQDLMLVRHAHGVLLQRIWSLRSSVSAYDATYVALAEALDMPLLTCDARLARAHGHSANIVLLA